MSKLNNMHRLSEVLSTYPESEEFYEAKIFS